MGILLLRKPLKSLVNCTLFRPFRKPPEQSSNLLSISLSAQVATAPIIDASFDEVSLVGALTNLIAVPLSGPILTLGLLGSILGNLAAVLDYLLNATNGFLVTLLEWTTQIASSFPFACVTTPGITPFLVRLFYVGCVPAALSEAALPKERWLVWSAVLVLCAVLWLVLIGTGGCKGRGSG